MDVDWYAVLLLLLGGAGLAGLVSGVVDRRHAAAEAERGREHDRDLAHDARLWEARSRLYEDLLTFMGVYGVLVEETKPIMRWGAPVEVEEPPTGDRLRLAGRLRMYGSDRVIDLYEHWFKEVQGFFIESSIIDMHKQQQGGAEPVDTKPHREKLQAHREKARSLGNDVTRAINEELTAGRPAGSES